MDTCTTSETSCFTTAVLRVLAAVLIAVGVSECATNVKDRDTSGLSLRLPHSVVPEHYDLELRPNLKKGNFTFEGSVRVRVRVVEGTSNVTLHASRLTVVGETVRLTAGDVNKSIGVTTSEDKERQFFILHPEAALQKGVHYVQMKFQGSLDEHMEGFYWDSYDDGKGRTKYVAATQFKPIYARTAFPCFDEPALKATFSVVIVRRSDVVSLSNMPLNKTEDRGHGWTADHFEKSELMSTYLVAFVVGNFKSTGTGVVCSALAV